MIERWREAVGTLFFLGIVASGFTADAESNGPFQTTIRPFLDSYCVDCHNVDDASGDRQFDVLATSISGEEVLVDYQDILDQLNLAEMPPPEAEQPTDEERGAMVDVLTRLIGDYHQARRGFGESSVLRRLNSREYRNTVRDLLHLNTTIFDPTREFPRDQRVEHFDNVGETLVTSSHLLARYLDAADQVISRALLPLEKPEAQSWTFDDNFRQQPEIDTAHRLANGLRYMTLYDVRGADKPEGAYGVLHEFADGVPLDGIYEIRIRAEAVNRLHGYDEDIVGTDRDEAFRLGIVPGDHRVGELHLTQPVEPLLTEIELADGSQWYTVRVPLDKGYTPRFTFLNGLYDARNIWKKIYKRHGDQFPAKLSGIVALRKAVIKAGKLPQIRIHEVQISGPIIDQWPTASQRELLGEDCDKFLRTQRLKNEQIRSRIAQFATRAYRREATKAEIDQVMTVVDQRRGAGRSDLDALADGFKMVLCSPNFLYLEQATSSEAKTLTQHALASRLSYFLWASMPDDELLQLATAGRLSNDKVLGEQVQRMLDDPRSDAFIEGFLDSWLALNELGSAPPDRNDFQAFYRHDLDSAMRTETRMFFRHMVDENLPLSNFVDSEFTFINRPLADLYEMDPPEGSGFARVEVTDRRRGGLLGQASVLTVSANGIDTSPVVRGVWMLENFLGTPPSPPPPDVEPLDPDTRGAKSIREQLSKHRDTPACYDCHRKIDPLGFALENFDPIGRWRIDYGRHSKIDPSGELPSGEAFADIVELKELLRRRNSQIIRAVTEKLLAYATGRLTVPSDRPHIDSIANAAGGTRDLIKQVVLSEPFRRK